MRRVILKICFLFLTLLILFAPQHVFAQKNGQDVFGLVKKAIESVQRRFSETARVMSYEVSSGFLDRQRDKTIVIWDRMITKAKESARYFFSNSVVDIMDKVVTPLKRLIEQGSDLIRSGLRVVGEYFSGLFEGK